jgi:hypothetical protein
MGEMRRRRAEEVVEEGELRVRGDAGEGGEVNEEGLLLGWCFGVWNGEMRLLGCCFFVVRWDGWIVIVLSFCEWV